MTPLKCPFISLNYLVSFGLNPETRFVPQQRISVREHHTFLVTKEQRLTLLMTPTFHPH